jgi:hypothetical protein
MAKNGILTKSHDLQESFTATSGEITIGIDLAEVIAPKNMNRAYSRKVFMSMGLRCRLLFLACVAAVAVRCAAQMHPQEFATTVVPRVDENLAENCTFKMTIPTPDKPVRAVWLTYDRGFDIMKYYDDPAVVAFAQRHEIALVLAHQCPAKDPPTRDR